MTNTETKQRKSLCEESMLVIVNILKLSSISLAGKGLAAAAARDHPWPDHPNNKSVNRKPEGDPNERSGDGSKRAQCPDTASKLSYVVLPAGDDQKQVGALSSSYVVHNTDGRFSDYIKRFHQKAENDLQNAIVEGKAADYIKRFHEKNRNEAKDESRRLSYLFTPPPHQVKKSR